MCRGLFNMVALVPAGNKALVNLLVNLPTEIIIHFRVNELHYAWMFYVDIQFLKINQMCFKFCFILIPVNN